MKTFFQILALSLLLVSFQPSLSAQDTKTTAEPAVSIADLKILVRPLMKEELKAELDGWLKIVQGKAEQIKEQELQRSGNENAGSANSLLINLRSERSALIERATVVVNAFANRGGDAADAQKYLKHVQSLNAPTTDISAAYNAVKAWASSKEGGLKWLKNFGLFALTLVFFRFVSRFVSKLVSKSVKQFQDASSLLNQFLTRFYRGAVMAIGLVIALSYLGVNVGPLMAAMGAIGFILAFALQGTLSNFAAGIMILLYKPYDLGDSISAAGVTGKVDSMNLVSTTLKTPDNQSVIVPNSSIWGDVITNITANDTRRVNLTIGISYNDSIEDARTALLSVVNAHDLVLEDPAPIVEVNELAASSVSLIVRPWCRTADYWKVNWDLIRQIKQRLDSDGISLPFPQTDVHLHQAVGA